MTGRGPIALLGFLLFVSWQLSVAQDHLLRRDDFNRIHPFWSLPDTTNQIREIENGVMKLSQESLEETWLYTGEQYLSKRANFRIEASFTLLESGVTGAYGLCWGMNEEGNKYFALEMNGEGFLRIIEVQDGEVEELLKWTSNRKIKSLNEENVVSLRKSGWVLYVEVNGKEIGKTAFKTFFGLNHGIYLKGATTVLVDYYMILHPPVTIRQLGSTWPEAVKLRLDSIFNSPEWDETHFHDHPTRQSFYFSRSAPGQNGKGSDIFVSEWQDTVWSEPESAIPVWNNQDANHVVRFSKDGEKIWLGSRYTYTGLPGGQGISMAEYHDSIRAVPRQLEIKNFSPGDQPGSYWISEMGKN